MLSATKALEIVIFDACTPFVVTHRHSVSLLWELQMSENDLEALPARLFYGLASVSQQ